MVSKHKPIADNSGPQIPDHDPPREILELEGWNLTTKPLLWGKKILLLGGPEDLILATDTSQESVV